MTAQTAAAGHKISLYAELLSNIKQISVVASLATPSDRSTTADISQNGSVLRIQHNGDAKTLKLAAPTKLIGSLPVQASPSSELSWRLPLLTPFCPPCTSSTEDQAIPWTSAQMIAGSRILCRHCKQTVVQPGLIKAWKDLPSENWAEMMEFWHCHKPATEDQPEDEVLARKGYAANNSISPQSATGMLDITSIMLLESDCSGLSLSSKAPVEDATAAEQHPIVELSPAKCLQCQRELGVYNSLSTSVKLFKWHISCETKPEMPTPESIQCVAASLTATTSRYGTAKSVLAALSFPKSGSQEQSRLESDLSSPESLHLWVLNGNVVYTSSRTPARKAAMKVLYQNISREKGDKLVESMSSDVQELSFSIDAIDATRRALEETNGLLPERERRFNQWKVGLIERWAVEG